MPPPFRYRLSEREKDALLIEQAALIERLAARVKELEALLAKPKKTSQNSHTPPSQDHCAQRMRSIKTSGAAAKEDGKRRKPRPSRPGSARPLSEMPDETIKRLAGTCPHCASDVLGQKQACRHRYDHIDIAPVVTRIEVFGGRCAACGRRFRAAAPDGMAPGSPFGTRVRALLLYLHHSHHISFERLSRMMAELFGLKISEGAIVKAFRRLVGEMTAACAAIKEKLLTVRIMASDETTSRIDGTPHWHWVFVSAQAVLHQSAARRAKAVAEEVLGEHRPEVWLSDRYAGPQDLAPAHQVCLAHVLRDVQYAIDCGDTVFAPRLRALLRWAVRLGRRRETLRPTTLRHYHACAERRLDVLVAVPAAHPAGRELQDAVKAWRTKFFVFLEDRDVPATNNACERKIRPSVVFRKVTGGISLRVGGPHPRAIAFGNLLTVPRVVELPS
jgi:transposase